MNEFELGVEGGERVDCFSGFAQTADLSEVAAVEEDVDCSALRTIERAVDGGFEAVGVGDDHGACRGGHGDV